ncbi:MAG: YncE family protein [Nitrososphaerales archaeon]
MYVVDAYDNEISVINGRTNQVIANITVGVGSSALDVNTRTNTLYVANAYDNTVSVVSL